MRQREGARVTENPLAALTVTEKWRRHCKERKQIREAQKTEPKENLRLQGNRTQAFRLRGRAHLK